MSSATERKVNEMCNLSEVLVEKGIEKGIKQGIEKGIKQGIEIGAIIARFEDGMSIEMIAEKTNVDIEQVKSILRDKGMI